MTRATPAAAARALRLAGCTAGAAGAPLTPSVEAEPMQPVSGGSHPWSLPAPTAPQRVTVTWSCKTPEVEVEALGVQLRDNVTGDVHATTNRETVDDSSELVTHIEGDEDVLADTGVPSVRWTWDGGT